MSSHISPHNISARDPKKVIRVEDFVRENGLDAKQSRDLIALFGSFATRQELLANTRRPNVSR